MKKAALLTAFAITIIGCQSQKTIVTNSKFKPIKEVESINLEALNYTSKTLPSKDSIVVYPSKFKSLKEVKGIDMGAQNYNIARFSTDSVYLINDSLGLIKRKFKYIIKIDTISLDRPLYNTSKRFITTKNHQVDIIDPLKN